MGVAVLLFAALMIYTRIQINKGNLVKWDNQWYTKEQLKEKFPPQYYEAPAKNTPEEVYAKFREALLANDIEGALGLMVEGKREEYRKDFENTEILEKYKTIPDVNQIKKQEKDSYGNFAIYYYFDEKQTIDDIPFKIQFEKNFDGYWEIYGI